MVRSASQQGWWYVLTSTALLPSNTVGLAAGLVLVPAARVAKRILLVRRRGQRGNTRTVAVVLGEAVFMRVLVAMLVTMVVAGVVMITVVAAIMVMVGIAIVRVGMLVVLLGLLTARV
jgi:hypothetical protein